MFDFVLLDIHVDIAQFFKFFVDTALDTGSTLRLVHNTTLDPASQALRVRHNTSEAEVELESIPASRTEHNTTLE